VNKAISPQILDAIGQTPCHRDNVLCAHRFYRLLQSQAIDVFLKVVQHYILGWIGADLKIGQRKGADSRKEGARTESVNFQFSFCAFSCASVSEQNFENVSLFLINTRPDCLLTSKTKSLTGFQSRQGINNRLRIKSCEINGHRVTSCATWFSGLKLTQ